MKNEISSLLDALYALKTSSYYHIDNTKSLEKKDYQKFVCSVSDSIEQLESKINNILAKIDN